MCCFTLSVTIYRRMVCAARHLPHDSDAKSSFMVRGAGESSDDNYGKRSGAALGTLVSHIKKKPHSREWRLFVAVAGAAGRGGLRGFESQNLANTAWAFAKAGHSAPALLDAIATVIR